ncbi:MAG: MFS transporter [Flavobacterium sp. BFFFF2]|nr:MAG: MFS transporter [Flavobacterium sp. BFFFF2]
MNTKKHYNFWQIWIMNFGFFGIQFSFGLQQSNMSAIYKYLGASEGELPMLWLAGPITGLVVQPIVGAISDRTWIPKLGRRKPFFLVGALLSSIALVLMPYSSSLFMAASLLWILDAANNLAMEPYRAFIADTLDKKQISLGFLMQSFFTGLGITIANFTPSILVLLGLISLTDTMDNGIPVYTYWAFTIGAAASVMSVLISMWGPKEQKPAQESEPIVGSSISSAFSAIKEAIITMPKPMRQLIPVKFFTWYAMFCYWQYITSALSLEFYHTTDQHSSGFMHAQLLTGQLNGSYNIICFLVALLLVPLTLKFTAQTVHCAALFLGAVALLAIPFLSPNQVWLMLPNPFGESISISTLFIYPIGLGIAWASMMAIPYQILAASVPMKKMGVYMGIFNLFIVIPMAIQILSMQFFVYDLLGQNPIHVIQLAGCLLLIGGLFTLRIKNQNQDATTD